jgi:hypothetical protein
VVSEPTRLLLEAFPSSKIGTTEFALQQKLGDDFDPAVLDAAIQDGLVRRNLPMELDETTDSPRLPSGTVDGGFDLTAKGAKAIGRDPSRYA